jgi:1,4-alpha-glucan branching enzyme
MTKSPFGVWECYVPPASPGVCAIPHDSMIKISMTLPSGESIDRIPVWIQRVTQDLSVSPIYDARFWNPPKEQVHQFKHGHSKQSVEGLKIYEAHGKQNHVLVVLMRCSRNLQPCDANHDLQRV